MVFQVEIIQAEFLNSTTKNIEKNHNSNGLLPYFIKSQMQLIVKMHHDSRDVKNVGKMHISESMKYISFYNERVDKMIFKSSLKP